MMEMDFIFQFIALEEANGVFAIQLTKNQEKWV